MSQVAAGVHRLEAPLGEQYVCIFVVVGEASALVVDTGVAGSPAATVGRLAPDLGVEISTWSSRMPTSITAAGSPPCERSPREDRWCVPKPIGCGSTRSRT